MFVYLIFLFLINKIYSISGSDEDIHPIPTQTDQNYNINLDEFCPCDINQGTCDLKCCCDPDCLSYMLDQNYINKFPDCDSSSSVSKRLDSKLDYCEDYKKSVEDLYNPLVLAFKILKKGFCLIKKNPRKEENNNNYYDDLIQKYNNEVNNEELDNMFEKVIPDFNIPADFSQQNIDNFNKSHLNAPISLPNGLCLFNSYPIKKLIDYEVECSYYYENNRSIVDFFANNNNDHIINYYIYDSTYSGTCRSYTDLYIKKIEITYYLNYENNINEFNIECYYENGTANGYKDFTFIVKFLNDQYDYIRSGNPGYIKGKPLLIGSKENDNYIGKYKNDAVFPEDSSNNIDNNEDFYFDNYFDNKITFEDLIIYGYKRNNNINVISQLFHNNILYGIFGNANTSHSQDWNIINYSNQNEKNIYLIIGLYKDVGATNNTQYQIESFNEINVDNTNYPLNENSYYYYFITKFLKKKTEKKWWYAPGPGFIKLPQNIMYPFRIGTTKYKR